LPDFRIFSSKAGRLLTRHFQLAGNGRWEMKAVHFPTLLLIFFKITLSNPAIIDSVKLPVLSSYYNVADTPMR